MRVLPEASITVCRIRMRGVSVPFRRPLATRIGTFREAPFLLLELELASGVVGRVPAFGFSPHGPQLIAAVIDAMAPMIEGRTIRTGELPSVSDEMLSSFMLLGRQGLVRFAQSILDMALHDAAAREFDMPLHAFLGAEARPLRAYNSNGLGLLPPEELADEAARLVSEGGYEHIKCRLGRDDAGADRAAVEAVRDAMGPGVRLSADFNQSLPSEDAPSYLRALDDLGLEWIEEPVLSDDLRTSAALCEALETPVQMGENYYGPDAASAAIDQGACDRVMPDVLRVGAVTGWLRAAATAARAGMPLSSHLSPEFSSHLLCATPTADWLEFVDWGAELTERPPVPRDGHLLPSQGPGAGVSWDEAVLDNLAPVELRS